MRVLSWWLLLVVSCGGGAAPTAPANPSSVSTPRGPTYEIVLERAGMVGRKARTTLRRTTSEYTEREIDGQIAERNAENVDLAMVAVHTTKEVSARGDVTRVDMVIERLDRLSVRGSEPILPAGTVVHVTRSYHKDEGSVEVDGVDVDAEVNELLEDIFDVKLSEEDDNALFGTKARQPVGGRWALDSARVNATLGKEFGFQLENMYGEMQVVDKTRIHGVDCLEIGGGFSAAFELDRESLHGLEVRSSKLDVRVSGAFPIDVSLPQLRGRTSMEIDLELAGYTDGHEVLVHQHSKYETSYDVEPLE